MWPFKRKIKDEEEFKPYLQVLFRPKKDITTWELLQFPGVIWIQKDLLETYVMPISKEYWDKLEDAQRHFEVVVDENGNSQVGD